VDDNGTTDSNGDADSASGGGAGLAATGSDEKTRGVLRRGATAAIRGRLGGVSALVLGVVGIAVAVVGAFLIVRLGFGATSTVDRLMEPVDESIDRIEVRIDQADDAVDRTGLEPERLAELRARSDGLLDMTISANEIFLSVKDHPIYGWLPTDLSKLESALADFHGAAASIDGVVSDVRTGSGLRASDAVIVADALDGMQSRVTGIRSSVEDASRSVRRWIRIGAVAAFLVALWGLWAQVCLARRGWRGTRGRSL